MISPITRRGYTTPVSIDARSSPSTTSLSDTLNALVVSVEKREKAIERIA